MDKDSPPSHWHHPLALGSVSVALWSLALAWSLVVSPQDVVQVQDSIQELQRSMEKDSAPVGCYSPAMGQDSPSPTWPHAVALGQISLAMAQVPVAWSLVVPFEDPVQIQGALQKLQRALAGHQPSVGDCPSPMGQAAPSSPWTLSVALGPVSVAMGTPPLAWALAVPFEDALPLQEAVS